MRFRQISTIFDVFSRISPLGNSPKMTLRKSGLASEFLENFIEKRAHFSQKTLFWRKAGRPYQKKARKFCCNFLHFWKIQGIFQILNFWSSHITGRFWKIHEKFQFVIFCEKMAKGRKRRNSLFSKNAFFRKMLFAIFYFGGLMPKWKNKVEKCPVRNINFVCNTKSDIFCKTSR